MEHPADESRGAGSPASTASDPLVRGAVMHIRLVTFDLAIPAEDYIRSATAVAPAFTDWPGLLGKWWLADDATGTYGGIYLFASREDADRSRDTDVFRGMSANPAFHRLAVREFDVLEAPTEVTAPALSPVAQG
jgi:hypothetical protein